MSLNEYAEHILLVIPAVQYMIDRAGLFNSGSSRHHSSLSIGHLFVKCTIQSLAPHVSHVALIRLITPIQI